MSLITYFYQVKTSFINFFKSRTSVTPEHKGSKYPQEVSDEIKYNLKIKCKKAAQEIRYLRSFSHWPIARAKRKIENSSLVYLDVSRTKRASIVAKNEAKDKVISVLDKISLSRNTQKKIP